MSRRQISLEQRATREKAFKRDKSAGTKDCPCRFGCPEEKRREEKQD
jgi:hypothetical protein